KGITDDAAKSRNSAGSRSPPASGRFRAETGCGSWTHQPGHSAITPSPTRTSRRRMWGRPNSRQTRPFGASTGAGLTDGAWGCSASRWHSVGWESWSAPAWARWCSSPWPPSARCLDCSGRRWAWGCWASASAPRATGSSAGSAAVHGGRRNRGNSGQVPPTAAHISGPTRGDPTRSLRLLLPLIPDGGDIGRVWQADAVIAEDLLGGVQDLLTLEDDRVGRPALEREVQVLALRVADDLDEVLEVPDPDAVDLGDGVGVRVLEALGDLVG